MVRLRCRIVVPTAAASPAARASMAPAQAMTCQKLSASSRWSRAGPSRTRTPAQRSPLLLPPTATPCSCGTTGTGGLRRSSTTR
eukprot:8413498-Pyramimonas_sp.AAC.1